MKHCPMTKTKTCAVCKIQFEKKRMGQKCCGPECSYKKVILDAQKLARIQNRKLKRDCNHRQLSWWHDYRIQNTTAWWFNRYIRKRDQDLPCVSCGTVVAGQWHCSHFRSVGAAGHLRYTPDNAHKSCSVCNQQESGNIGEYRIALIDKIGLIRVEALENNNQIKRWSLTELEFTRDKFKLMTKEMK